MAQQLQQRRWSHITWKLCRIDGWVVWRFFNLLLLPKGSSHTCLGKKDHIPRGRRSENLEWKKIQRKLIRNGLLESQSCGRLFRNSYAILFCFGCQVLMQNVPLRRRENLLDFGRTCSSRSWVRMEIDVDRSRLLVFSVFYSVPQDSRLLLCFFFFFWLSLRKLFVTFLFIERRQRGIFPHTYSRIFLHTLKAISRRWQCERISPRILWTSFHAEQGG